MTDLLADIKTFLVGKTIEAKLVSIDALPDDMDKAIAIYEYQGSSPLAQIDGVSRSIQIVARSKKAAEARELARRMYGMLRSDDGIINLTADRWSAIHLRQPPFKFKTDETGRTYYAFNMGITTYED